MVLRESKKRKESGIKNVLITLFLVVLGVISLIFLLTSNIFNVKSIEIKNIKTLSKEKIEKDSRIVKGRNIFLQRYFKGVHELKKNPKIKDVKIIPLLPDKIEIEVSEREEVYQISDKKGYYILDNQGYILRRTDEIQQRMMIIGLVKEVEGKSRLSLEELYELEKVNSIRNVLGQYELLNRVTSIEKKDRVYILELRDEKKKIILENKLTELRAQIAMSKTILEIEKDKEGEIFLEKNSKRQYMIFREKI